MKYLRKFINNKLVNYVSLLLNLLLIILIVSWMCIHSNNMYLHDLLSVLGYKHTQGLVNLIDIAGIITIVLSLIKYIHSENQDKFIRTVKIMSHIRNEIYKIPAQNSFDKSFNKSKKLIVNEIRNQAFSNFMLETRGSDDALTEDERNKILNKISYRMRISEKDLEDKARLRVVGNIIVQLNIWALYINRRSVDMSLVNTQLRGDILGFLSSNKSIYFKLKRENVPLVNLQRLQDYWGM